MNLQKTNRKKSVCKRRIRKQDHEIMLLAKNLQSLALKAVVEYKRELDEIVDSNCQDKQRIERILDGMLDFCFHKNMLTLYKKLCRYYFAIDQDATVKYVQFYREMWDDQKPSKK